MDLLPLLATGQRIEDLVTTVETVPAGASSDEVNACFRSDASVPAVLIHGSGGRLGLISRLPFQAALTGRLGFGGALYGRRCAAVLADWSPLVLPTGIGVQQAAVAVLGRSGYSWQPDALVEQPGGAVVGVLTATAVLTALAGSLAQQALHDTLTGLANRELFLGRLRRAAASAEPGTVVVFFLDLDGFKQINDQLGHSTGDRVLQHVARRLTAAARPGDLVARLAGDEFAVLLRAPAAPQQAELIAEVGQRFLTAVECPLLLAGRQLRPRVSIGAAIGGPHADGETLIREADLAMYQAKRAGGNTVVVVDQVGDALGSAEFGLLDIDDTLPRALKADQFRVHYQPIVDLTSGRVMSVEALVRWEHPTAGLRGPVDFLPEAQRTGFIADLGAWVLDQACGQLAEWDRVLGQDAPAGVNVNLAIRQMADPALVAMVEQTLRRHGLEPARLVLELPEGATLRQLCDATSQVHALRQLGVRVTLDDLGTGASSLRHLSAMTIDGIKIDQVFIAGMLTKPSDAAVVRLLIDLGQALRIPVTAEGVETAEQWQALREFGCTYVQGYYLARPAEHAVISRWIANRSQPEVARMARA